MFVFKQVGHCGTYIKLLTDFFPVLHNIAQVVTGGFKSGRLGLLELNSKEAEHILERAETIMQIVLIGSFADAAIAGNNFDSGNDVSLRSPHFLDKRMQVIKVFDREGTGTDFTTLRQGHVASQSLYNGGIVKEAQFVLSNCSLEEILAVLPDDPSIILINEFSPLLGFIHNVNRADFVARNHALCNSPVEEFSGGLKGGGGVEDLLMVDQFWDLDVHLGMGGELGEESTGAGMAHEDHQKGTGRLVRASTLRQGASMSGMSGRAKRGFG